MSKEQILTMLQSGTITADEAARLLEALAAGENTPAGEHATTGTLSPVSTPPEPDQIVLDAFKPEFKVWSGLLGQDGWNEALEKGLKQCNFRLVEDYMVKVPHLSMGDTLMTAFKVLTEKNLQVRMVPVVEAEKVEGVVRIPELFETFVSAYRKI